MSDNLTPYERTYGAPLGKAATGTQGEPAPQPTTAPQAAPAAQGSPEPAAASQPKGTAEPASAGAPAAPEPQAQGAPEAASQPNASEVAPGPSPVPEPQPAPGAASGAVPAPGTPGEPQAAATPAPSAAPPMDPVPPAPRKVWPWVVLGVAVALVLVVGGCASCAVMGTIAALDDYPERGAYDPDEGDDDRWRDYLYDEDAQEGQLSFEYTIEELEGRHGADAKGATGSALSEGIYVVGGKDGIAPGTYRLQGSQDEVGQVFLYDPVDGSKEGKQLYELHAPLIYLGDYLVEVQEGQAVAFIPPLGSNTMALAADEAQGAKAPYLSGCYRVGLDIPAGTYVITVEDQSIDAVEDSLNPFGAYVMDDLRFDDDSVVESLELIPGGKKTVTVKAGQFLELYGTQAVPASEG